MLQIINLSFTSLINPTKKSSKGFWLAHFLKFFMASQKNWAPGAYSGCQNEADFGSF